MIIKTTDEVLIFEHIGDNIIISKEGYGSPYGVQHIETITYDKFISALEDIKQEEEEIK